QQLDRRVRAVRCQTEGVSGSGQGFVDAIVKECVLIMKNRSGNEGVLERQDRAVASVVNITIDGGVSAHQKISVPSQAKIAIDKSVTKSPAEVIAVAQGKRGPALEIAYFGNNPRDIGLSISGAE